jgi:hypothetical protein
MLSGVGLAQDFSVEAVDTIKYLVNMSPSSALVEMNPHEVWSGKKPSISHLKFFGCDAFLDVPKEKRRKLIKKAVKCIFIGYKEGMKGYKLWDHASRKTVYGQDVVFIEVKRKFEPEEMVQTENNPENVRFELRNEEDDLDELNELEEESKPTSIVRRSKQVIKPV